MPDNANPPLNPDLTFEQLQAQNEETARKLADQGRDISKPPGADDFRAASEGLDALAESISKKNDPAVIEAEAKAKADAEEAARKAAESPEAKAAAEKAAADKAEADAAKAAAAAKAEEFFKDSPGLPPNASPKSADAFNGIKVKAAQEISARDAEIEKLKKDIAERDEKLKNPIPPETEKEIKDLREWRAKLDVEADPKFKEFDRNADNIREFIYEQLRNSPNVAGDKLIAKIKEMGGPEKVVWDKIFTSLNDPTLQKIIESKISDIELMNFNKAEAIKTAKKNIQQYVAERSSEVEKNKTARFTETQNHLKELTGKLDFLKPMPDDPKADAAKKAAIADHNKWAATVNENIQYSIQNDNPETYAILVAGMANLMHANRQLDAKDAENKILTAENAELKTSLAKLKNASVNRIREGNAPASGDLPKPKTDEQRLFNTPATQALDDIAKDISEKRKAAGQ